MAREKNHHGRGRWCRGIGSRPEVHFEMAKSSYQIKRNLTEF